MRLSLKLSLLFLGVIAFGATATFVSVRRTTSGLFRSLVIQADAERAQAYASMLAEFRRERRSWEGVQRFLVDLPRMLAVSLEKEIRGEGDWPSLGGDMASDLRSLMADRIVLADHRGIVVADTHDLIVGSAHPGEHLDLGAPVMADFEKAGTVLVGSMIDSSLSGANARFLGSIARSILYSTAASAALAVAVGLLFSARITKPLGNLAEAARDVSSGRPAVRVRADGKDEIAELAEAFNDMKAELKRLDDAKRQVIADSAHELRTPVTLIRGMVEAMMDGVLPLDAQNLSSVHEETIRLAKLIDTLRELEIIEFGELSLSVEGVDLAEAIEKAVSSFAAAASAKSMRLAYEPDEAVPTVARGDYLRLGEVIYNLVSNALKYTPRGGTVVLRTVRADDGFVRFSVEDSGPGIAPEDRRRVFDRFFRLDKSRSSETGGRGLGLAIAMEIVKAHGGGIDVEASDLGGASFVVTLPRHRQ